MTPDDPDFPIAEGIPHAPAVLFVEGDRPDVLKAPRVAVVGTRAASVHGLTDAWELGAFLGAAGVSVVSGMAIGIDGAAHHGALKAAEAAEKRGEPAVAGPVGVLATGLDVVYPRRHRVLFERVRRYGVLLGEQPFGVHAGAGAVPGAEPDHRRTGRCGRGRGGHAQRWVADHRRTGARLRAAGAGHARLPAQSGGRRLQRPAGRRRSAAARSVRRARSPSGSRRAHSACGSTAPARRSGRRPALPPRPSSRPWPAKRPTPTNWPAAPASTRARSPWRSRNWSPWAEPRATAASSGRREPEALIPFQTGGPGHGRSGRSAHRSDRHRCEHPRLVHRPVDGGLEEARQGRPRARRGQARRSHHAVRP